MTDLPDELLLNCYTALIPSLHDELNLQTQNYCYNHIGWYSVPAICDANLEVRLLQVILRTFGVNQHLRDIVLGEFFLPRKSHKAYIDHFIKALIENYVGFHDTQSRVMTCRGLAKAMRMLDEEFGINEQFHNKATEDFLEVIAVLLPFSDCIAWDSPITISLENNVLCLKDSQWTRAVETWVSDGMVQEENNITPQLLPRVRKVVVACRLSREQSLHGTTTSPSSPKISQNFLEIVLLNRHLTDVSDLTILLDSSHVWNTDVPHVRLVLVALVKSIRLLAVKKKTIGVSHDANSATFTSPEDATELTDEEAADSLLTSPYVGLIL